MHNQPDFFYLLINENVRKYASQRISMHIMAGLFLVFYGLQYLPTYNENWMYLVGILPVSILVILLSIFKKVLFLDINNNRIFRILETGFLMMACMHFLQTNQHIAAVLYGLVSLLILYLLSFESRMLQEQYIIFNKDKIQIELPIFTKNIKWSALKNVVQKNDFLTFEFKNDTFAQYKIKHGYDDEKLIEFTKYITSQTNA
jgi:hypothetical protein